MSAISERIRWFAANGLFPSLFLGVFGVFLAHVWGVRMGGSWQLHALLGIPGSALSVLVLYRARLHWSVGTVGMVEGTSERRRSFHTAAFPWYLLLFAAGVLVALSTISAVLLGLAALLTYAVPWAKIPVCRSRFIVSSIVMLAGAIGSLAVYGKPVHPLHYLIAAWVVSFMSMIMLVAVLFSLPYGYRVREPALASHG
jgi:hypothetical protein